MATPHGCLAASLVTDDDAVDFSGATLVLPTLSLGSIDQMAMDLLVNTLLTKSPPCVVRVGRLVTPFVEPVVGSSPFGSSLSGLANSLEVYFVAAAKLVLLQQRAPATSGQHEAFVSAVFEWAAPAKIARIVALAAIDGISRVDSDFKESSPLRYIATAADPEIEAAGAVLLWREFPSAPVRVVDSVVFGADGGTMGSTPSAQVASSLAGWTPPSAVDIESTALAFSGVWGSGYAPVYWRRSLSSAASGGDGGVSPPPSLRCILAVLASEGVNVPHAAALAELAAQVRPGVIMLLIRRTLLSHLPCVPCSAPPPCLQVLGLSELLILPAAAAAAAPSAKADTRRRRGVAPAAGGLGALGRFVAPPAWHAAAVAAVEVDALLFP